MWPAVSFMICPHCLSDKRRIKKMKVIQNIVRVIIIPGIGDGEVVGISVVVGCSVVVVEVGISVVIVGKEVVAFGVDVVGPGGGRVPPAHSGTFCGKSQISKLGLK